MNKTSFFCFIFSLKNEINNFSLKNNSKSTADNTREAGMVIKQHFLKQLSKTFSLVLFIAYYSTKLEILFLETFYRQLNCLWKN